MKPLTRAITHNTHPGEILSELIIKSNNLTVDKASKLLGVSRPNLSNIVNCKSAISPLMAIRISKVFGGNAAVWIRLQYAYVAVAQPFSFTVIPKNKMKTDLF